MQLLPADIPSNINTVERLVSWAGLLLNNQAGTLQVNEIENTIPVFAAQAQIIRAADESTRLILRQSFAIDESYSSDTSKKLWMFTDDLVNTVIPTGFKVN
jgi:hypothetical protein